MRDQLKGSVKTRNSSIKFLIFALIQLILVWAGSLAQPPANVVVLQGRITQDSTLTADKFYAEYFFYKFNHKSRYICKLCVFKGSFRTKGAS